MDSTKEIKERIKEIQEASNHLLQSSQNCTTQINHGMDLVRILENNFSHISASATKNAGSAEEIKNRIGQESEAFGQIVATLHQVSHSIENFSESTRAIISTAQILESNAKRLSGLKEIETITEKL
jgi:methyl-accepting chemotaxis protein